MTIRKIVLIPSLLLASVAYLAFAPHTQPAPPASMPVAHSAPAAPAAEGRGSVARATPARANAIVPSAPAPIDVARV